MRWTRHWLRLNHRRSWLPTAALMSSQPQKAEASFQGKHMSCLFLFSSHAMRQRSKRWLDTIQNIWEYSRPQ